MKQGHIFFDMDGTLMDTGLGITKAVQYSLKRMNIIEKDLDKLKPFIGPPLHETYTKLYNFSTEEYYTALEAFHEYYRKKGIFEARHFPHMQETLAALKEAGKKLYVATSKPEPEARIVTDKFGLDRYFEYVGGSDGDYNTQRATKADVIRYVCEENNLSDMEDIIMVGDKSHDVTGAGKVGMKSIGVLYGYGDYDELSKAGADYICDTVLDLKKLLLE